MTTEARKCLYCDADFTVVLSKNNFNKKVYCTERCAKLRHGARREYRAYCAARLRSTSPNVHNYHRYGGRGIEFRFKSFEEFLADIGPRPSPRHSLDRILNNGHYEVGNVVWATSQEQARNRKPVEHTSKYVGVSWNTGRKKWVATVTLLTKKPKYLGLFLDEELAHAAVVEARDKYGITEFVDKLAQRGFADAVAA